MATSTSAVTSPSECEEGTVSGLSAGLETMVIGTAKAVDEGTVSSLSTGPDALAIGTAKAFQRGYEYCYRKGRVGEEFVYRCTKGSDYSLKGENLYILFENGYYVAYDAHINADQRLVLRQPVFRTKDKFFVSGTHCWELNYAAHASSDLNAEPDWRGNMSAETRLTL